MAVIENQINATLQDELESHTRALIRTAENYEGLKLNELIFELSAIIKPQDGHETHFAFKTLKTFYQTTALPDETLDANQMHLQRKKVIRSIIEAKIEKLTQSTKLNRSWSKASRRSSTFSSIFANQKLTFWISIEIPANKFIQAILDRNESAAQQALFTNTISDNKMRDISLETQCYLSYELATQTTPKRIEYFQRLYDNALIPTFLKLEAELLDNKNIGNYRITLKDFKLNTIIFNSCTLGLSNIQKGTIITKKVNTAFSDLLFKAITKEVTYDKDENIIEKATNSYKSINNDHAIVTLSTKPSQTGDLTDKNTSESDITEAKEHNDKRCCTLL